MAQRPTRQVLLQSAATTGNGTAINTCGQAREHVFYIVGSAGVSAGAVTLETATDTAYAGTWEALSSAVTVAAGETVTVAYTGVLLAVRARITTTVTDGTVTVTYIGN